MPAAQPARKKSAAAAKSAKPDLAPVFAALRQLLQHHAPGLNVQTDKPDNYHLECPSILHRRKPLYFAGVRTGKNYVSFHLLYAYYNPKLRKSMSSALQKRMQGKACFNFTAIDQACFAELGRFISEGLKIFKSEEFRQAIQKMQ
jgi:hypothetical protein